MQKPLVFISYAGDELELADFVKSVIFGKQVPLDGVEPPAQGLGNLCSIQLSYRGDHFISMVLTFC